MEKDELLREIAYSVAIGEPAIITPIDSDKISIDDVLDGTLIELAIQQDGVNIVALEGTIIKEKGQFNILMSHNWYRKYWQSVLGMPYYMDLMKRLVEFRKKEFLDVDDIEFVDEGDWCHLYYKILVRNTKTLYDAYNYGLSVDKWIQEIVTRAEKNIGNELMKIQHSYSSLSLLDMPELVTKLEQEKDSNEKGKLLEELVSKIFSSVEGFTVYERVKTDTEEIDLAIMNTSKESIWARESQIILVECKNWSTSCGKNELVIFKEKLKNRKGRAKVGFFVSWNGFASTFNKEDLRSSQNDELIIPVDGEQIKEAINSSNFEKKLSEWWFEAIK